MEADQATVPLMASNYTVDGRLFLSDLAQTNV